MHVDITIHTFPHGDGFIDAKVVEENAPDGPETELVRTTFRDDVEAETKIGNLLTSNLYGDLPLDVTIRRKDY